MPQQGRKRPPEYVEAVGWKSSRPMDMTREATSGGVGMAGLGTGTMEALPGYGEVVGSGRGEVEAVRLQMPREAHVR